MTNATSNEENQELPVGYRFVPTDLELAKYYLSPKVLGEPVPAPVVIDDIDESEVYSKPPNKLEMLRYGTKECFFFIHRDGCSHHGLASRMVGNKIGFWKSDEEGTFICDSDGRKLAFKICWTYYSGTPKKGKRTPWVMFEYRLQIENECNNREEEEEEEEEKEEEEWILGRIKYSWNYRKPFD